MIDIKTVGNVGSNMFHYGQLKCVYTNVKFHVM